MDEVFEIVGFEQVTGIPDAFVRDVVWDCDFDVNQSVNMIYGTVV